MSSSAAADAWQSERGRLVGIAYRMLGDFGHAEDVVSEVAIEAVRQERAPGEGVRSWPAWLTTVCVRRSIDRVRQLAAIREEYPGPWLPEAVATAALPEDAVADRELLSLALLHLAEQLAPEPRAALVLHRAFGMTAVEIGETLGKTPAAIRQMISRAERRLQIDPDSPAPRAGDRAELERLAAAIEAGEIDAVLGLIAPDAVLWADGGGRVRSSLNPIFGAERIARFFLGILDRTGATPSGGPGTARVAARPGIIEVNGSWALVFRLGGRRDLLDIEFAPSGGIRGLRQLSNPEKLRRALPPE